MKRIGAALAAALVLDLLVVVLAVGWIERSATLDATQLVSDEGLAWRTPNRPLSGILIGAVSEGAWSPFAVEAELTLEEVPLGPARSAHAEIRELGGGRWSYWRGQLFLSTTDGSDPRERGHSFALRAPMRPTPLLIGLAFALTALVFALLLHASPVARRRAEVVADFLATSYPGGGPHPLSQIAPWLLALTIGLTSIRMGARWLSWDFSGPGRDFIPPFLGPPDLALAFAGLATIIASRVRPTAGVLFALLAVIVCFTAGGIDEARRLEWHPQLTGVIWGARFAIAFLASWCVAKQCGPRGLTLAIALLGVIWMARLGIAAANAEGQFLVIGGHFPSFAGMLLALVALYSMHRGALAWAALALVGILATGSRGAFVAFPLALLLPMLRFGRHTLPVLRPVASETTIASASRRRIPSVALAVTLLIAGVAVTLSSSQLRAYLLFKLQPSHWLSFGRRTQITEWTMATIDELGWRTFGWGSGRAPAFIAAGIDAGSMPENWGNLHVVWLEWLVELGIFAVPIAALIIWRTFAAWRRHPLAASIWILFILSQSTDYWLWSRDGLILWGIALGLAEACPKFERSAMVTPRIASV